MYINGYKNNGGFMLAIDIGNTTIALAVVKKGKTKRVWRIETALPGAALKGALKKTLSRIKRFVSAPQPIVVCSVVPAALKVITPLIRNIFGQKPVVIGRDIKVPIRNLYRKPRQVGQDRLVGAYAAMKLYGVPVVIIDLGTAVTLDVVSKHKEYLGGIIVPGLRLSAESLFKKTAMLPKIKIKQPHELIGRDTKASILSGLFFGYGALCSGLIDAIAVQIQGKPKVVLTGGHGSWMKKFITRKITAVDDDLVFKGIDRIFRSALL